MSERVVVSNAGPLMVFAKLNLLHLLKELYVQVIIPEAVYEETVINEIKCDFEDAHTLRLFLNQTNWKPVKLLQVPQIIASTNLDKGEKEAIAWALSKNTLLLMDEELGREVAREQGVIVRGSLGILIQAYQKNLIRFEQLRFYFKQISSRSDIWISSKLCDKLLENIENLSA